MFSLLENGNSAVLGHMFSLPSISTSQELRMALEGAVNFKDKRNELSGPSFEKECKKRLTELPVDERERAFLTQGREKAFHLTHLVALYGDIYELIDFLSFMQTIDSIEDIESVIIMVNENQTEASYEWVVFSRNEAPVRYSYADPESAFSLSVFRKITDGKLKGTIVNDGDSGDTEPQTRSSEIQDKTESPANIIIKNETDLSAQPNPVEAMADSLFHDDPAGEVYFLTGGNLFKVSVIVKLGTGQVFNHGFKMRKDVLEYVRDAYLQFREAKATVSDKIDCRAYDYSIRYECLTGRQVTTELSLPTFIGLCSASLQRPIRRRLLTVLDETIDNMMMEFFQRIIPGGIESFLLSRQSNISASGDFKTFTYDSWPEAAKTALSIE